MNGAGQVGVVGRGVGVFVPLTPYIAPRAGQGASWLGAADDAMLPAILEAARAEGGGRSGLRYSIFMASPSGSLPAGEGQGAPPAAGDGAGSGAPPATAGGGGGSWRGRVPDFAAIAATGDAEAFLAACQQLLDLAREEATHLLAGGDAPSLLLRFLNDVLRPATQAASKASVSLGEDSSIVGRRRHEVFSRLTALGSTISLLRRGAELLPYVSRRLTPDDSRSLFTIVNRLETMPGNVSAHSGEGLVLAGGVGSDSFEMILSNLVRNAMGHPRAGEVSNMVHVDVHGDRLIVNDHGAGMTPEVVRMLEEGVRIHDGQPVTAESDDEARPHGHGWGIIRDEARKLGITIEIESKVGESTTVTLTLPRNFWDVDEAKFFVKDHADSPDGPALAATLTPQGRFVAAAQLFDLADKMHREAQGELREFIAEEGREGADREVLKRGFARAAARYAEQARAQDAMWGALLAGLEGLDWQAMRNLRSSATQGPTEIFFLYSFLKDVLAIGQPIGSNRLAAGFAKANAIQYVISEERGFQVTSARKQLAFELFHHLIQGTTASLSWNDEGLVIRAPVDREPPRSGSPFARSPWSPDLNDPSISVALKVLGWRMRIVPSEGGKEIEIHLNFGEGSMTGPV